MLPHPDLAVLSSNPRFEALYNDLRSHKLNLDGTSKLDIKAQKEAEELAREIVQRKLEELVLGDELPEELKELVALAAATLGGDIPPEDRELVDAELERLQDHWVAIATCLSRLLTQDMDILSRLLPDKDSDLPASIRAIQASISNHRASLASTRQDLTTQLSALHTLHRTILSTAIRLLEQTLHGSLSRHARARAEYLLTTSDAMLKKLQIQERQVLQTVYSSGIQNFLTRKFEEGEREEVQVRRKIREAEEKLEAFGRQKGMKGLVAEYGAVLEESRRVSEEVRRLEEGR